ncbi:MAG: nicotinic acid mononucleotide adenylyltransferase [Rhodobiaceae bacterium]|nr:nicotinic acid mononucleotide adenylyltransferase [Hyphomicrobiales bacterium]MBS70720.1 nicotinic acid mononucleotide adenylyltransferase [Rhodobiaceae bacterium]MBS70757.1 nicotinic acid mononucleotide adenylyltransferase [Rhodobiaceae bacterium]MEC7088262.1 nicotinate-nucleotide adenylyltransferase [Pseudomonadota bacterium]MEC8452840.1 nicotinate-nucleotide adenylyltransferase [Pseudomonadota bacterium]|tara:strand:+ start:355 stop:984 length:630 start_codon:yes stop_codon:yes gene_type:complete
MISDPKIKRWITSSRQAVCSSQKIGLLGGSFNPAHHGHLSISKIALRRLGLNQIWWIVSPRNPLKEYDFLYDFEERVFSARKIINTNNISISKLELNAQIKYTIGTLEYLRTRYHRSRFVWIMGADNLNQFHLWKEWEKIIRLMPIAIIDRPSSSLNVTSSVFANKYRAYRIDEADSSQLIYYKKPAWVFMHTKLNYQSSSQLRNSEVK